MKLASLQTKSLVRIVILQYDEMEVIHVYEYEKAFDRGMDPHHQMQVVMARGLFSKLKQPIHTKFDVTVRKNLIDNLLFKLHEIGFTVVGIVSDLRGWGQSRRVETIQQILRNVSYSAK